MQRLSPASRALSALLALWFAFVLGEPAVLHACPMHGDHASHGAMASAGVASEHAQHAMPADAGAAHHDGKSKTPAGCSCVGHCCATAAPVAPTTPTTLEVAVRAVRAANVVFVARADVPRSPDVRIPWALGPPTA